MNDFAADLRDLFIQEVDEMLGRAEHCFLGLEQNPSDSKTLEELFRIFHNVKGGARSIGYVVVADFSHEVEDLLVLLRGGKLAVTPEIADILLKSGDWIRSYMTLLKSDPSPQLDHSELRARIRSAVGGGVVAAAPAGPLVNGNAESTHSENRDHTGQFVRIPMKKIEDLLNSFGEQVILQSALDHAKEDLEGNQELVFRTIAQLNKLTYDLQQTAMSLRMVNLHNFFSRLARTVRDTGVATGKQVRFESHGQDSELDKPIVDALLDAFIHMVRNAVDHGLESVEDRLLAGKDPCGVVRVEAYRKGGSFVLEVSDDGKGLDPDLIFAKAVKAGLVSADRKLNRSEILELLFESGFSTRDTANEISGRGIGMNVVKESVLGLKGSYEVYSELGKGTRFLVRVPLTLALFNGMILRVGQEHFVVPASDIEEVIGAARGELRLMAPEQRCIRFEERVFPLLDLRKELNKGTKVEDISGRESVLVVKVGDCRHALLVDEAVSLQKVVHKPLSGEATRMRGASGATILGDGTVAIILELARLIPPCHCGQEAA